MSAKNSILFLDDSEDLQILMKHFIERTCDCKLLAASSLSELKDLGSEALNCKMALLDINLGPDKPSGIDGYHWLHDQGFRSPIYFFTGHAPRFPLVQEAERLSKAKVLTKPVDPKVLKQLIRDSCEIH